jgi:hypothetical protein
METTAVTGNDANNLGDALYLYSGSANLVGSAFSSNSAVDVYNYNCGARPPRLFWLAQLPPPPHCLQATSSVCDLPRSLAHTPRFLCVVPKGAQVSVYSTCGTNQFNAGTGTLSYTCKAYPADMMTGTCSACASSTPYACCGSRVCTATSSTCSAFQTTLCSIPSPPTPTPPTPGPPTPTRPPTPGPPTPTPPGPGPSGPAPAPKSGGAGAAVGITFGLIAAFALAFAAYWFWRKKQGNPIEMPEMPKFDALPDFSDCAPSGYERFNCMDGAGGAGAASAPLKTDEYRVLPSGPTPTAPARGAAGARAGARPGARGAAPAAPAATKAATPVAAAPVAVAAPAPASPAPAAAARSASGARPARPVRK